MRYSNTAYDYERTSPMREAAPVSIPKKRTRIRRLPVKYAEPRSHTQTIFMRLCIVAAVVFMVSFNIYTQVEINNVKTAISAAESEISRLESESVRLNMEFESIVSYSGLEQAALEIGMQKKTKAQIHYINTSEQTDYAEILN